MRQISLDELGTPLAEVTFCVVDLETTGGSPAAAEITEIGALKVRRGEVVGTFQTLVDPGEPVPAFIRLLTGISDELLVDAPAIEAVLPSFLSFVAGTVLVAHNARFDISFLNAALKRRGYERLPNRVLDTATLARKIVAGEVPNNRLATLARYLRCANQPTHRAFPDVLATTDVLHHLIERVAGYGVTTLEDLAAMSSSRMDGTFHKISLAEGLPECCGIYRFLGASGNTLYVGKATNVKARVRSYFYGDPRRKIRDLLRETQRIEVERFETTLEAEVHEARAIQRELPPYNRAGKRTGAWYVKVSDKAAGKVGPTRVPKNDGSAYVGPFASLKVARTLVDALRDAAVDGIERDPDPVFDALEARMTRLARLGRFEEAAEVRDRAGFLARALAGAAETRALVDAGDVVLGIGNRALLVRNAQLAAAVNADEQDPCDVYARLASIAVAEPVGSYFSAAVLAEARVICSWLRRNPDRTRIVYVTGDWLALRSPAIERFAARHSEEDNLIKRSSAVAAAPESIAS